MVNGFARSGDRARRSSGLARDPLSNLNLEECFVSMVVPPLEILALLCGLCFAEFNKRPMLPFQIDSVGSIFLFVPSMVVFAVAIVVAFIGSFHRGWSEQGGADQKGAQNHQTMHYF